MNNDLIRRSEALDIIRSLKVTLGGREIFHPEAKKSVLGAIDDLPNVDAEPARRGRWLTEIYNMKTYETVTVPFESWKHSNAYCSECKAGALCNGHEEDVASRYCPNCGAKMDLEEMED